MNFTLFLNIHWLNMYFLGIPTFLPLLVTKFVFTCWNTESFSVSCYDLSFSTGLVSKSLSLPETYSGSTGSMYSASPEIANPHPSLMLVQQQLDPWLLSFIWKMTNPKRKRLLTGTLIRSISSYWPELFRSISSYWPEPSQMFVGAGCPCLWVMAFCAGCRRAVQ